MQQAVTVAMNGGKALFRLAVETDPAQGAVDLSETLPSLVLAGLNHPYTAPEDGVPLGQLELVGDVEVHVDGRTLGREELDRLVGAGFVRAIKLAIEAGSAEAADKEQARSSGHEGDGRAGGPAR